MSQSISIAALAHATPASRDRFMDMLRALSIAVVVLGHWLMAIVYLDGGRFSGENALDVVPGLWLVTWLLQVMPLFFIVGGFSNLVAWRGVRRRGETYVGYLSARMSRLMRPTIVFVVAWTSVATAITLFLPERAETIGQATGLLAKPLWFLAVYVLMVALAPVTAALHGRYGARVLVAFGTSAVVVDIARIAGGLTAVGYLNFAFVWLFAHQLGYFYADGRVDRFSRRFFIAMGLGALVVLALLTGSGIYSPSMVGMAATDAASNNSPPSVCLVVLTVWLGSLAMLLRPAAGRWLQRRRVWLTVVAANSMIMTVFLWHLTALLVAVVVLYPIGFPQPEGGTALWWAWRPVWLVALSGVLAVFLATFGRLERRSDQRGAGGAARVPRLKIAASLIALIAGLAGLAQFGFALTTPATTTDLAGQPLVNAALILVGHRVLVQSERSIGG